MKPYNGTVETLGHLKLLGMRMYGHCGQPNCGQARVLNMDKLIALFGEDFEFVGTDDIQKAYVCEECRRTGGTVTIHGADNRKNAYAKAKGV